MWKLLLISFMVFQIGCAKKNSAGKIRQGAQNKAKQTQQTDQELKLKTDVEAKAKAEAEDKLREKPPVIESAAPTPAVTITQPTAERAENPLVSQTPAVPAKQPQPRKQELASPETSNPQPQPKAKPELASANEGVKTGEVKIAADSEKIKNQEGFKIAFRNLEAIKKLSENKNLVIMKQKEVELTSPQALLGQANEEQFCQIQLNGQFHPQDFLLLDLDSAKLEQTDKELDLYRTEMKFKNANGVVSIVCDHTTNNFYFEDMYKNLGKLIVIYGLEGRVIDVKKFVNPRTERRLINAIKLKDVEILKQITLMPDTKEGLGIASGVVDSADRLINFVAAGEKPATCVVSNKWGEFSKDLIYIRVEKGILVDTPKEIPAATLFSIYRADSEHAFELSCFMKKSAEWNVLFEAMKGVFEFGVLERPIYNKTFDEIKALHNKK